MKVWHTLKGQAFTCQEIAGGAKFANIPGNFLLVNNPDAVRIVRMIDFLLQCMNTECENKEINRSALPMQL